MDREKPLPAEDIFRWQSVIRILDVVAGVAIRPPGYSHLQAAAHEIGLEMWLPRLGGQLHSRLLIPWSEMTLLEKANGWGEWQNQTVVVELPRLGLIYRFTGKIGQRIESHLLRDGRVDLRPPGTFDLSLR